MPIISYEDLKQRCRAKPAFYRGFFSYELGYKFLGIRPRKKAGFDVPEVFFQMADASPAMHKKTFILDDNLLPLHSNLSREEYFSKIHAIKEYLSSGDTYQVNFSQQFSLHVPENFKPWHFFQALSQHNPSPHQFFCETDDFAVISNSPELLVRGFWETDADGRKKFMIETRPIKGTVPRGKTSAEDAMQIQKLLQSKKDEAELTMIVDLERNDLGKVCKTGSIHVKEHRRIEKYSHVIHTVSVIQGELEEGKDVFDVIEAMFPSGSITGCPKKRTMEIIDELEDIRRGVYCGSAGYIAIDGSFEFNIMIRTAFLDKKLRQLSYNAGGGIVIDSDPQSEYEETLHKAAAFFDVLWYIPSPSYELTKTKNA